MYIKKWSLRKWKVFKSLRSGFSGWDLECKTASSNFRKARRFKKNHVIP
jgi:hypothetical protein